MFDQHDVDEIQPLLITISSGTGTKLNVEKETTMNNQSSADDMQSAETTQQPDSSKPKKYPKVVFLVIINELCQKFSLGGLRTVLFLYLGNFAKFTSDETIAIFHGFNTISSFTPIIGAILADGYFGLFKTILYISCVYCSGELVLALTSIKPLGAPNHYGPIIGLTIIALGTGGITPCVSAFGANQFESGHEKYRAKFFSIFYLTLNIGSLASSFFAPLLRKNVKCFGDDCYPLVFGVSSTFMFLSIIVFVVGSPLYRRHDEANMAGSKNIILQTCGCLYRALKGRVTRSYEKRAHWLDYASEYYSTSLISDVKAFWHVVIVFLPLPVYWALADQQGSRWTSQAQQLNGRIGSLTIEPDQMQLVNPVLLMLLIPTYDYVIFPFFARWSILKNKLHRMSLGLCLAIVAFCIAAVLESQMQQRTDAQNPATQLRILNLTPCNVTLARNGSNYLYLNEYNPKMPALASISMDGIPYDFQVTTKCRGGILAPINMTVTPINVPKTLILNLDASKSIIVATEFPFSRDNPQIGVAELQFAAFRLNDINLSPALSNKLITYDKFSVSPVNSTSILLNYTSLDYNDYTLSIKGINGSVLLEKDVLLETCGRYTALLFASPIDDALDCVLLSDIVPNGVLIAWQCVQIFVMTNAEILFSISGLAFAYDQAPATMKSVLTAAWLLTSAVGNLIIVFLAESKFVSSQTYEYLLFAGLLLVATFVFMILSYFYKHVENEIKDNNATAEAEAVNKSIQNGEFNPVI